MQHILQRLCNDVYYVLWWAANDWNTKSMDIVKSEIKTKPSVIALLLLMSLSAVCTSLISPALPMITTALAMTEQHGQLLITVSLVGYAFGQILFGSLANILGRKNSIYVGLMLATISAAIMSQPYLINNYTVLLVMRFLNAVGASVGLVLTFTLVNDFFEINEARKIISHLSMMFAAMPAFAVMLGGYLVSHYGWSSCFIFTALYSLSLLLLVTALPEKHQTDSLAIQGRQHYSANPCTVLKNKKLLFCSLIIGCATACDYIFVAIGPFLCHQYLGLSPERYALFYTLPIIGLVAGGYFSARLSSHLSTEDLIFGGIILSTICVSLIWFLFYFKIITVLSIFVPTTALFFGLAILYASTSVTATYHVPDKANASGVMSFLNISVAAVLVYVAGKMPGIYALPLGFLIAVIGMIGGYVVIKERPT